MNVFSYGKQIQKEAYLSPKVMELMLEMWLKASLLIPVPLFICQWHCH